MTNIYDTVNRSIRLARIAAFAVDPMNPSLTIDELRTLVVQDGHATPLFEEAWDSTDDGRKGAATTKLDGIDLIVLRADGGLPPQIPHVEANKVCQAFLKLNQQMGVRSAKTVQMLAHNGMSTVDVERGLGLLLHWNVARRVQDGYVCEATNLNGYVDVRAPGSPLERDLALIMDRVRNVFAARRGTAAPTTPPLERFHVFLKKQGLEALAGWWAMTTQELRSLGERHPTASTVLAASMLEAALVAIAEPSRIAGEWRRDFLQKSPKEWKLGELIAQADTSSTFTKSDVALAETLAELRNRIHVGKYAVEGTQRFRPPFSNAQEATIAVKHLEHLLAKLLDWAPIAALTTEQAPAPTRGHEA